MSNEYLWRWRYTEVPGVEHDELLLPDKHSGVPDMGELTIVTWDNLDELQDVKELIEKWETIASQKDPANLDTYNARCETYALCAEKMRKVIEDE